MPKPITELKPLRCSECGKLLRNGMNKSGLCLYHKQIQISRENRIKKRLESCSRCGIKCSGKLRVEVKADVYYGFCSSCFNKIRRLNTKEIRKIVYSKSLL